MVVPTFKTDDFEIFFFDKNDTGIDTVSIITVEDLVMEQNNPDEIIAFVSSANSLGFMDGGSDLGYMKAIPGIQSLVQKGIKILGNTTEIGRPYLHIGDTMGFFLENPKILFISAPTMFLPQNIHGTSNQYYALKSALQLCKRVGVKKIFTPLMCTGWGGYSYEDSFELMKSTINNYQINTHNKFVYKDVYIYNINNSVIKEKITNLQPKVYMNTEFGISINELFR